MPELVHSELPEVQQRRVLRLLADIKILRLALTRGQTMTVYSELEAARDALSLMLDQADGKNA